jgi:hypothetical protein
MLPNSVQSRPVATGTGFDRKRGGKMDEFKITVPTYYGAAHCKQNIAGDLPDFDSPNVPVLIHEATGIRIVLGTHDFNDPDKPDIQIERRPKGWAIFLHPVGGGDASGYVYFLDDGRSFLLKEGLSTASGSIEVLCWHEEPPEIDEIDLPEPDIRGRTLAGSPGDESTAQAIRIERRRAQTTDQTRCARCGQTTEHSGDWYDDLCPGCADETDCDWRCRSCGQQRSFEVMGGEGATNPVCCGVPCHRIDPDESTE